MSVSAFPYGIIAQAAAGGAPTPFLQTNFIVSSITGPTSFRPLASLRLLTGGDLQKAEGSTQAPLSYSNLPNNQWDGGAILTASDYEVYFDSLTNSMIGAGSWSGDLRDQWLSCGTQRTWTLEKNTSGTGSVSHTIILEIREIANTANTSGQLNQSFTAQVDL